jgi:hypothetical protein
MGVARNLDSGNSGISRMEALSFSCRTPVNTARFKALSSTYRTRIFLFFVYRYFICIQKMTISASLFFTVILIFSMIISYK